MEQIPRQGKRREIFDWRTHVNAQHMSAEHQDQLDTIAAMAREEHIDIYKNAEKSSGIGGDGKFHQTNVVDALIMWAYNKSVITDEEYRALQKSISS